MAETKFGDTTVHTAGELPSPGKKAPDFKLTTDDMKEVSLSEFAGKKVLLNIFPSIDTRVCSASVREFNKRAASIDNTVVVCVSKDLPFALKRFCAAEGIDKVSVLSDFRSDDFGKQYGTLLVDGPFYGLHARAVVAIDESGNVIYNELVPAIGQEPDYEKAIAALTK